MNIYRYRDCDEILIEVLESGNLSGTVFNHYLKDGSELNFKLSI